MYGPIQWAKFGKVFGVGFDGLTNGEVQWS